MPRVVYREVTFERISSRSWYERDFENLVSQRVDRIFPRWTCVPFTASVFADDGTEKRPDLALIDEQYREWWVVEVELEHHSLYSHVIPQVEVFASGRYTEYHARWLAERNSALDVSRLTEMMLGQPPGVLVVVDSPHTDWREPLAAVGAELAIAEPFKDDNGEILLRVNGLQPEPPGEILTLCARQPHIRRLWKVASPAALPRLEDDAYSIEHDGIITEWSVVRVSNAVMLKSRQGDGLPGLSVAALILRKDGSLAFVENPATRRRRV